MNFPVRVSFVNAPLAKCSVCEAITVNILQISVTFTTSSCSVTDMTLYSDDCKSEFTYGQISFKIANFLLIMDDMSELEG